MIARVSCLLVLVAAMGAAWPNARASKAPPPCQAGALVSLRTGKVLREYSVIGGGVPDGRGGWFVVSGTMEIRRMRHDGSIRTDWHSRPTGRRVPAIGEIVRVGGRLFVEDGYRVYAISAATGRRIWTSQRADRGGILALAATSSAVYIGGDLAHVGDVHRGQIAALDPRTGRLLPWRAPALALFRGSPPDVSALAVLPPRLYLGGSFLSVGRAPRKNGVAAVGLRNGALSRFAPRKSIWNLSAMAVASRGRLVLIGGREGGGVFDAVTGAERTLASGVVSRAGAISVRGSIAYLGGNVQTPIGGHNLLAVNLRSGMMQPWRPRLARYVSVGPIALSGDRALVGGQFCSTLGG